MSEGDGSELDIVVVTWNSIGEIDACLAPLMRSPERWTIHVVDNASKDGTAEHVRRRYPRVRLIRNGRNEGFARANNQVLTEKDTPFVLLLNPDTECSVEAIEGAVEVMRAHPDVGALGVRLLNSDGSLQPSCFRFPNPAINLLCFSGAYCFLPRRLRARLLLGGWWAHDEYRPVDWILGAFMLVRREAVRQAGPLPEEYFLFTEDMGWCKRIWDAGFQVAYCPSVPAVHHGNRSAGQNPSRWRAEHTHRGKYRFCREHYGRLATRFIQWTDFVGYSLRSLRYRPGSLSPAGEPAGELMRLGRQVVGMELRSGGRESNS